MKASASFGIISLAVLLAVGACAQSRSGDPFAEGTSSARKSLKKFHVRLEVGCSGCLVSYAFGSDVGGLTVDGNFWNRAFLRFPMIPEPIRLTTSGGTLRSVSIYVGTKLAAREVCESESIPPKRMHAHRESGNRTPVGAAGPALTHRQKRGPAGVSTLPDLKAGIAL